MGNIVKVDPDPEFEGREIRIRLPKLPSAGGLGRNLLIGGAGLCAFIGAIVTVSVIQSIISAVIPGSKKDAGHGFPPANEQLLNNAGQVAKPTKTESPQNPQPAAEKPEPQVEQPVMVERPVPAPQPIRSTIGPGNFDAPEPPPYNPGQTGPGNF